MRKIFIPLCLLLSSCMGDRMTCYCTDIIDGYAQVEHKEFDYKQHGAYTPDKCYLHGEKKNEEYKDRRSKGENIIYSCRSERR